MFQRADQIDAHRLVALRPRRISVPPLEAAAHRGEHLGRLDDVAFDPTGHADDLTYPTMPRCVHAKVHDQINRRRNSSARRTTPTRSRPLATARCTSSPATRAPS